MTDKFRSKLFKRGEKSKNIPNPLTEEQLMTLYNHTFELKHLETVRKMILLQCFVGMRFDDIKRIRPENIQNNFLMFTPKKTERFDIEQVTLTCKELYDLVWAEPLSRPAKRYKISDNSLKKICKRMNFHLQKCKKLIPVF
jgi:hypothetical protein